MADPLEIVIGYRFSDPKLLKQALSHKSFASESGSWVYNERLEFLGDSILAAVVAHFLFNEYPSEPEGVLSKKKASLVSKQSLAKWGEEIGLGSHLYLGVGEETTGGRTRQSLIANALEALIGAIYLDGGYEKAAHFVRHWTKQQHLTLVESDYKSQLQEMLQKRYKKPPTYKLLDESGPDHDKTFSIRVGIGTRLLGHGTGKSKKQAEQEAARDALSKIKGGN